MILSKDLINCYMMEVIDEIISDPCEYKDDGLENTCIVNQIKGVIEMSRILKEVIDK